MTDIDSQKLLPTQHITYDIILNINTISILIPMKSKTSWKVNSPPPPTPKENNSVYYFRERISLCSCGIVQRRTNLMISISHGLLNMQATISSAISRVVMLLLCQFPSLSVHDSAVRTKYLYLICIWKEIKKKKKMHINIVLYCGAQ